MTRGALPCARFWTLVYHDCMRMCRLRACALSSLGLYMLGEARFKVGHPQRVRDLPGDLLVRSGL
jgi:hypothetical protein